MLKFTYGELMDKYPCSGGLIRLQEKINTEDPELELDLLSDQFKYCETSDLLWCLMLTDLPNNMKRVISVTSAINCAKSVLHLFEDNYHGDTTPRLAIDAAEVLLKNNFVDPSLRSYSFRASGIAFDTVYGVRSIDHGPAYAVRAAGHVASTATTAGAIRPPCAVVTSDTIYGASRTAAHAMHALPTVDKSNKEYLLNLLRDVTNV